VEVAATTQNPDISTDMPTLDEVSRAISKLRNGRAAGPDGIPPELLKCAIGPVSRALHSLFCQVWTSGLIPSDWRDGILVALYKGQGARTECSNYRPITLLSVPGKVFAHVLLARLQLLLDATRRPEQSGFVAGRSTIDAILALRLLSELHREFDRPLNVAYLDIKAAFDSVDRLALWKALRGRGVPDILLDLIISLHENTGTQVRLGQDLLQRFVTTSGVRQGCMLAPALFCVAIDWILRHMPSKPGIEVGRSHFSDLVYADDTAFLLESANDAAASLSSFNVTASTLGLRVSWPKTKLQNLSTGTQPSTITADGHPVDSVNSFVYLGSLQSSNCNSRADINRRIGLASSVMSSLQKIWKDRNLSTTTKVRVYQALVTSVLLYASETWTVLASDLPYEPWRHST